MTLITPLSSSERIIEWARMDVRQLAGEWCALEAERDEYLRRAETEGDRRWARRHCDRRKKIVEHIAIFLHGEDEWSNALG